LLFLTASSCFDMLCSTASFAFCHGIFKQHPFMSLDLMAQYKSYFSVLLTEDTTSQFYQNARTIHVLDCLIFSSNCLNIIS